MPDEVGEHPIVADLQKGHEQNEAKIEQLQGWWAMVNTRQGQAILVTMLGLFIFYANNWLEKHGQPPLPIQAGPTVNNIINGGDPPSPVISPTSKPKIALWLTESTKTLAADPSLKAIGFSWDGKAWADGSMIPIKGKDSTKNISLPCVTLADLSDGTTITSAADVAAFWKKVNP